MKKVAILQSNYIPWKGYFDMIAAVDEFIVYDDVQFTKNDWRNRNKIKSAAGLQWLTIPVRQERLDQKISETKVSDKRWTDKHWKTLRQNYGRTEGFQIYSSQVAALYERAARLELLSDINKIFIRGLCEIAGINTIITSCADYEIQGNRVERLINLCKQSAANVYFSGPAAKSYLDERLFLNAGLHVEWMDYSGYPEYPQTHPSFEHGVSILDLLFNAGAKHSLFMKHHEKAS